MRKPTGSGRKTSRPRAAAASAGPPKKAGNGRVATAAPRRPAVAARAPAPREGRTLERRATEKIVRAGKGNAVSESSTNASRGKYVYCIIEAGEPLRFGPVGIGADASEVYTVH